MLFGCAITRNLLILVKIAKIVSRLPDRFGRAFAGMLEACTGPFDRVNYWRLHFDHHRRQLTL